MIKFDPSIESRVADLLSRMSWEGKVAQLGSMLPFTDWGEFSRSPLSERIKKVVAYPPEKASTIGHLSIFLRELPPREAARKSNEICRYALEHGGIPPLIHDEGLHGLLANDGTSFPQSIHMASSWDPALLEEIAQAIGIETRARGIRQLLSPTINIARDPRCGRTEETYGEDPMLAAEMAVAFIHGVQSQGVVTTPKHYAANFVGDGGRDSNAIHFTERLMREIYFPAFEAAVRQGGALSIMAAYNSYDGLPCSCNPWLLTEVLREEWGFQGYVVSDYDSVIHILEKHQVAADKQETAKRAVEAGMDVELPFSQCFASPMLNGIADGSISKETVDEAVRRVLRVKFWLGLFDTPYVDEDQAERVSHSPAHQDLALKMAREGMVLLKNEKQTLPIPESVGTLAVIGPQSDELALGGYTWEGYAKDRFVTPLQAISTRAGEKVAVSFAKGCNIMGEIPGGIEEAVRVASRAQYIVLCLGNNHQTEGEQRDRASLDLPGVQPQLVKAISALGIPTVVVLINGSAITMTDWVDQVGAVLEAWYPGEKGATAIAEIIFGDTNPSGKLPITFPRTTGQLPLYYNYKPSGRITSYVDKAGSALFPFGHGLSYTNFAYQDLKLDIESQTSGPVLRADLELSNTGQRTGVEIVQLYIHDKVASLARPVKELKAFQRVTLEPGNTQHLSFQIEVQKLGMYDQHLHWIVEPGDFEVLVGSSSEDIRLQETINIS
jgi:beta-glucosidase